MKNFLSILFCCGLVASANINAGKDADNSSEIKGKSRIRVLPRKPKISREEQASIEAYRRIIVVPKNIIAVEPSSVHP